MTTFGSTRMIALALAGTSVLAIATPADAAWRGRNVAIGAGVGLAAGALIGSAIVANSQPRAYYSDGYGYYGSPYQSYSYYEPAPTYYAPAYYAPAPTSYGESYGYAPAPAYYGYYPRNGRGLPTDNAQRP